ncbi:MAG: hypothetical protein IKM96_04205, partial [Clostridiales bacterium]|nr:hypothetical protein [Clostridiales bacterium]
HRLQSSTESNSYYKVINECPERFCFGHFDLRWRTFSTAKKRDLKTCKVPVWLTVLTKTGTQTVNIATILLTI